MRSFLLSCLLLISSPVWAQQYVPEQKVQIPNIQVVVLNRDFVKYETPKRKTPSKQPQVEVLYFYYYGSPAAYKIDRSLRQWAQTRPYMLKFTPVPIYFDDNPFAQFGARIHYALQAIGEEQRISPLFMEAVHTKRVNLNDMSSVLEWMENRDVNMKKFMEAINSKENKSSVRALPLVARRYNITSTPAIVIDGEYLIALHGKRTPEHVLAVSQFMADKLSEGGKRP